MSHRPIADKRRRRVARKFRQPLPTYFDLFQWLLDHGHASTRKEAAKLCLDEGVKYHDVPVGVANEPRLQPDMTIKNERVAQRYVSTEFRKGLVVDVA
jgi:hypothetical protein